MKALNNILIFRMTLLLNLWTFENEGDNRKNLTDDIFLGILRFILKMTGFISGEKS
jgi:hypothetical protein